MGHTRLRDLPRTRKWAEVIELLESGGDVGQVARRTLDAARHAFRLSADDAGVAATFFLLARLPLAARNPNYVQRLNELGLPVKSAPSLIELVTAFSEAIDGEMRRSRQRTDLGEMAQLAATETLTSTLSQRTQSLFETSPEDVRRELAALATTKEFGSIAHEFLASLTRRYLGYFLSREIPNHVGGGRRFANISEHEKFNEALALHCRQAARIAEKFLGAGSRRPTGSRASLLRTRRGSPPSR